MVKFIFLHFFSYFLHNFLAALISLLYQGVEALTFMLLVFIGASSSKTVVKLLL